MIPTPDENTEEARSLQAVDMRLERRVAETAEALLRAIAARDAVEKILTIALAQNKEAKREYEAGKSHTEPALPEAGRNPTPTP